MAADSSAAPNAPEESPPPPNPQPHGVPNSTAPFLPIEDEYCCFGKASIGVDLLDAYQDIPFGTPAHEKATDVEIPARTPSRRSRTRGPQIRMVPRLRSCRSHPRRPGLGYRAQPQTNQAGRKNPNRQATPSGQAQKYPADPHEHPRQRPLPSGAARLGTRPLHSTDSNPTVGFAAPRKPRPGRKTPNASSKPPVARQ